VPRHSVSSANPQSLRTAAETIRKSAASAQTAVNTSRRRAQQAFEMAPDVVANSAVEAFTPASSSLRKAEELARYMDSLADAFARADNPYFYGTREPGYIVNPYVERLRPVTDPVLKWLWSIRVDQLAKELGKPQRGWRTAEEREREREVLDRVMDLPPEFLEQFIKEVGLERFFDLYETFTVDWLNPIYATPTSRSTAAAYQAERAAARANGTEEDFYRGTDSEHLFLQSNTADEEFVERAMREDRAVDFNARVLGIVTEKHWGSFVQSVDDRAAIDRHQGDDWEEFQHRASNSMGSAALLSGQLTVAQQRDIVRTVHATTSTDRLVDSDRMFLAAAHADVATPIGFQAPQLPGEMLGGVGDVRLLTTEQSARLMDNPAWEGYGRGTFGLIDDAFDSVGDLNPATGLNQQQAERASHLLAASLEHWGGRPTMDSFLAQRIPQLQQATSLNLARSPVAASNADLSPGEREVFLVADGAPNVGASHVGVYAWDGPGPSRRFGEMPAAGYVFPRSELTAMARAAIQSDPDAAKFYWESQGLTSGSIIAQLASGASDTTPFETFGQGLAISVGAQAPNVLQPVDPVVSWMAEQGSVYAAKGVVAVASNAPYIGPAVKVWQTAAKVPGVPSPDAVLADVIHGLVAPDPVYRIVGGERVQDVEAASLGHLALEVFRAADPATAPATFGRFVAGLDNLFVGQDVGGRAEPQIQMPHTRWPDGRSYYNVISR